MTGQEITWRNDPSACRSIEQELTCEAASSTDAKSANTVSAFSETVHDGMLLRS